MAHTHTLDSHVIILASVAPMRCWQSCWPLLRISCWQQNLCGCCPCNSCLLPSSLCPTVCAHFFVLLHGLFKPLRPAQPLQRLLSDFAFDLQLVYFSLTSISCASPTSNIDFFKISFVDWSKALGLAVLRVPSSVSLL